MTPEKIGRYQVTRELGRGGFAVVYLANDPFVKRQVAVKVLPAQFTNTEAMRARFQQEAEIIATLEHPAIVPIYDYGEFQNQPFIVMRYMAGGSLAERVHRGGLEIEETTQILSRISSALDRAHDQGIIHRDLKPGNILFDQYGDAYLSDFGIARLTEASLQLTGGGAIGTPAYMSPEQVYGDRPVDGRSDIYALGVILFEMLTGTVPYEADTPAKLMMKHILEPVPRILTVKPDLPQGCDALLERAMAKEPDQRFTKASEFATAVTHLNPTIESTQPPIAQSTPSPSKEIAAPISEETVLETPTPPEVRRMAEATQIAADPAPSSSQETEIATPTPSFPQPGPKKSERPTWLMPGLVGAAAFVVVLLFIVFALNQSGLIGGQETANTNSANGATAEETDNTGSEIDTLPRETTEPTDNLPQSEDGLPARLVGAFQEFAKLGRGFLTEIAVSPDGTILAAGSGIGIWLYDAATLNPIVLLEGHTRPVQGIAWSPDGRFLASASQDGNVKIWDIENDRLSRTLEGHQDMVSTVAWSHDGSLLASAGFDNVVRIWDPENGRPIQVLEGHEQAIRMVSWPPDNNDRVASASEDGAVNVWFLDSGNLNFNLPHSDIVEGVLWSNDGGRLITGSDDNQIRLWDAANGNLIVEWVAHEYGLVTIALAPNGQFLASTGNDGFVRVWDLETELEVAAWGGANNSPVSPSWLPDSQQLALSFTDNLLGIWQARNPNDGLMTRAHTGQVGSIAWAPEERGLVSGHFGDDLTRLWNLETLEEAGVMRGFTGEGQSLSISADGALLAKPAVGIEVFDLSSGFQDEFEPIFAGGDDAYVNAALLSPDAAHIAAINWDGILRVWNLPDQQLLFEASGASAEAIAWTPEGDLIASPALDQPLIVIWDSQTGEALQAIPYGSDANITGLDWSPDGRFLAATDTAGMLNVWERDSWGIALSFQSFGTSLNSIDWSLDGRWLAAGSWSGSIYVWDATGIIGTEPALFIDLAHLAPVTAIAWSPSGTMLASGSHDGTVRIWRPEN